MRKVKERNPSPHVLYSDQVRDSEAMCMSTSSNCEVCASADGDAVRNMMGRKGILDTTSRSQIRANNPWQIDTFLSPQLTVILLDGPRPFREVLEGYLL